MTTALAGPRRHERSAGGGLAKQIRTAYDAIKVMRPTVDASLKTPFESRDIKLGGRVMSEGELISPS